MYNLLMTAGEGNWDQPTWIVNSSRYLEYTNNVIAERFRQLSDDVILSLLNLPTLFTYESYLHAPAYVGRITSIERRLQDLKIGFARDPNVPMIQYEALQKMANDLDISDAWEWNRTHWAIKDVDLTAVLRAHGIIGDIALAAQPRPPKVFISYSWDTPEHSQWVAWLGSHLRSQGIDVVLDQWYLHGGMDVANFMASSLRDADRVLVICTENYAHRANTLVGGVGFESMIVSGELMSSVGSSKFIPILKQESRPPVLPTVLNGRYFYNLSDGEQFQRELSALIRELHGVRTPIPPLGARPQF